MIPYIKNILKVKRIMNRPNQIRSIWNNNNATIDCMTFVFKKSFVDTNYPYFPMIGTCETGIGFSQFTEGMEGKHLGKKVLWSSLSPELQKHIVNRIS